MPKVAVCFNILAGWFLCYALGSGMDIGRHITCYINFLLFHPKSLSCKLQVLIFGQKSCKNSVPTNVVSNFGIVLTALQWINASSSVPTIQRNTPVVTLGASNVAFEMENILLMDVCMILQAGIMQEGSSKTLLAVHIMSHQKY